MACELCKSHSDHELIIYILVSLNSTLVRLNSTLVRLQFINYVKKKKLGSAWSVISNCRIPHKRGTLPSQNSGMNNRNYCYSIRCKYVSPLTRQIIDTHKSLPK